MPSPKNSRKGANNTNLNVGTLYNLPPNAPQRRTLIGHIGGLARSVGGAAVGGLAYLVSQSAQRGFNTKQPAKPANRGAVPGRVLGFFSGSERTAQFRRQHNDLTHPGENAVGAIVPALTVAGAAAIHGATAAKRAHNLSQAAKTGFYPAKVLRYAVR